MMTTFRDLLEAFERRQEASAMRNVDDSEVGLDLLSGPLRTCSMCHEVWPLDHEFFHRHKDKPEGFEASCIACCAERRAAHEPVKSEPATRDPFKPLEKCAHLELTPRQKRGKACTCCNKTFPLTLQYWIQMKSRKSGLSSQCKACIASKRARQPSRSKEVRNAA
jgi:hypothetical protein